MNKSLLRLLRPLLLLFVLFNAFFLTGSNFLEKQGVDQSVLIIGNLLLFLATAGSVVISWRGVNSPNPQASVRSMYGSFMIKFFGIAIAAFIYIMIAKKSVNKPALIGCAGLYIVYTFIEVSVLTKMLKKKKNG